MMLADIVKRLSFEEKRTKKYGVEAPVWHVFIHKYFLVFFQANAYEPHKVLVLKLGD